MNEGLGYIMGRERGGGQAISTCTRLGCQFRSPWPSQLGPVWAWGRGLGLLGLMGLGTVGRQQTDRADRRTPCTASSKLQAALQTARCPAGCLLSGWPPHPCRPPSSTRMESSPSGPSTTNPNFPTSSCPLQRQQRSRYPTRHRSARGPSPDLPWSPWFSPRRWRVYAYCCCKMI